MIHVLAIITAKPGMRDRILEAFRNNTEAVRAEAGCIQYEAVVDVANGAASLPSSAQMRSWWSKSGSRWKRFRPMRWRRT